MDIRLRYQQVSDARRFYEILTHPDFVWFSANPASIEAEKEFLRANRAKRRENREHNFTILLGDEIVGAVGVHIDPSRPYVGEIGYFVDRAWWGRGIASRAVGMGEEFGFRKCGLHRMELIVLKGNRASIRVAEKCGYRREGIQRGKLLHEGKYQDAYLYAKLRTQFEGKR